MKFSFATKLGSFLVPAVLSITAFGEDLKPAQSPPAGAGHHFGVIDMQRIILTVDDGKTARASLEKEIKQKEEEFRKKKEELDKLNKEWSEQAPLLSEEARIKKQKDFQERLVGLRNSEMTFQNEIKQKEGHATQRIAMKVTSLVDGFARERSLDAVFELNSSGLLYVKNPVDLTDHVIKKYNETAKKDQKAGGPKEAAKPTTDKNM